MNQAHFRFLISIILSPTDRLRCFKASLTISVRLQFIIMFFHQYFSILLLLLSLYSDRPLHHFRRVAIFLAFPRSSRHWLAFVLVPSSTLCALCELGT